MSNVWKAKWSKKDHEEMYNVKLSDDAWEEIVADLDEAVMWTVEGYVYNE